MVNDEHSHGTDCFCGRCSAQRIKTRTHVQDSDSLTDFFKANTLNYEKKEIKPMSNVHYAKRVRHENGEELWFVRKAEHVVVSKFVQRTQVIEGQVYVVDGGQTAYRLASPEEVAKAQQFVGERYLSNNLTAVDHLGETEVPPVVKQMAVYGAAAFPGLPAPVAAPAPELAAQPHTSPA